MKKPWFYDSCKINPMAIENKVYFPLTVRFEDGQSEIYENQEDLELNLEDFDSEKDIQCEVRDALGRKVHLKIDLLSLTTLELETRVKYEYDAAKHNDMDQKL